MKLSAYIVRVDSGFAPNPFGRHCSLACCKPTIRRKAEVGDIVIGTTSGSTGNPRQLIYAMRVAEVLPMEDYFTMFRFRYKKFRPKTSIGERGDNVWRRTSKGWAITPGALHNQSHETRDIGGKNVLISRSFFYFGRKPISIPTRFHHLLAITQGHRNTHDEKVIKKFWKWLESRSPRKGRIELPSNFDETGCCDQKKYHEPKDATEHK